VCDGSLVDEGLICEELNGHQCSGRTGAVLSMWDRGEFVALAENNAPASGPEDLVWTSTDPALLQRLGDDLTYLQFVVQHKHPSGSGGVAAEISTDYVELTVRYRLP